MQKKKHETKNILVYNRRAFRGIRLTSGARIETVFINH